MNEVNAFDAAPSGVSVRPPCAADARHIWEMVRDARTLDLNSPYAYLLLCTHFAGSSIVASRGHDLTGFVLGYRRPDDARTAFVWQVAVAPHARGQGLGRQLLDTWFARCALTADVQYVEATVTPSNDASRALFSSFAARHGASAFEEVAFAPQFFPTDVPHEEEVSIRIGPISRSHAITFPAEEDIRR